MKKNLFVFILFVLTIGACKSKTTEQKTPEEKKVEGLVKTDKEKLDSVEKYWKEKMKATPDSVAPASK